MLCMAWFVSLQLTKQRIALETYNKLNNIEQQISPFVWDFSSFDSDIVESFHQYWTQQNDSSAIVSAQIEKPQLSLNFSGEVISTFQHKKMIITSANELSGRLTIQAKINLQDDVFYYLPAIKLSTKKQTINLDQVWKGLSDSVQNVKDFSWDKTSSTVSSLVLLFEGLTHPVTLETIKIPYNLANQNKQNFSIDCDGKILEKDKIIAQQNKVFTLTENCWLPSNYMWLNDKVNKIYPGSVFVVDGVTPWAEVTTHKVNKSYTNNVIINSLLYAFVALFLFTVFFITKKYSVSNLEKNQEKVEKWYLWTAKQLVFKGARKVISPYHLMLNYSVVLIPTLLILITMLFVKVPSVSIIKMLPVYFLWAMFQQFILGYVLAQRIFYNKTQSRLLASLLAAAVFSLLHMPSVNLMIMTFIAGGLWAYAWLVFKRLIPLALSHSLLAIVYYTVVSDRFLFSAKTFQWFWE